MMTGKVNTSVLPEPVKAIPIMSRPDRLLAEDRSVGQVQQNTGTAHTVLLRAPRSTLTWWGYPESE